MLLKVLLGPSQHTDCVTSPFTCSASAPWRHGQSCVQHTAFTCGERISCHLTLSLQDDVCVFLVLNIFLFKKLIQLIYVLLWPNSKFFQHLQSMTLIFNTRLIYLVIFTKGSGGGACCGSVWEQNDTHELSQFWAVSLGLGLGSFSGPSASAHSWCPLLESNLSSVRRQQSECPPQEPPWGLVPTRVGALPGLWYTVILVDC